MIKKKKMENPHAETSYYINNTLMVIHNIVDFIDICIKLKLVKEI